MASDEVSDGLSGEGAQDPRGPHARAVVRLIDQASLSRLLSLISKQFAAAQPKQSRAELWYHVIMPICSISAVVASVFAVYWSVQWNGRIARTLQVTTASLDSVARSVEATGESGSDIATTVGILRPVFERAGDSSAMIAEISRDVAKIKKEICGQSAEIVGALQDYARPTVSIVDFSWDVKDDRPVGIQFTLENLSNVPVTICSASFETVCSQQPIDKRIVEYPAGRPFIGRGHTLQYWSHSPGLYPEHLVGTAYLTVKFQATVSRAGDNVQYVYNTTRTIRFPDGDSCVLSETLSGPESQSGPFLDEGAGLGTQGL